MLRAEKVIDIEAPVKKVWEYLGDFSHWGDLFKAQQPDLTFTLVESALMGVGRGRKLMVADGKKFSQEWSIVEWEPPKALRLTAETAPAVDFHLTLTPTSAAGTRVELRYQMDFKNGWIDFFGRLMSFEKRFAGFTSGILERLKDALQP